MATTLDLGLLLTCAEDGGPALLDLPSFGGEGPVAQGVPPLAKVHNQLGDPAGDQGSLKEQRWGVVIGGNGSPLLDALAPLIALRAKQQGADIHIFRTETPLDSPESATQWVRDVYSDPNLSEEVRPRYLLIVGNLSDVSLDLQEALSQEAFVGRVSFSTPDGAPILSAYNSYAEKVCRAESDATKALPETVLYLAKDGSPASSVAEVGLFQPFANEASKWVNRGLSTRSVVLPSIHPDPSELVAAVQTKSPSVLFSISHGVGAPRSGWRSVLEQRSFQGALVLPRAAPHAAGKLVDARTVGIGPFLPGGVWFCFGCFGAGTPARSDYEPWLAEMARLQGTKADLRAITASLPKASEPPFIAAMPQAALANPEGPLAVFGHIDLLFAYTFRENGVPSRSRAERFSTAVKDLVRGRRVGVALSVLMRGFRDANNELAKLTERELRGGHTSPTDPTARVHLFMLRNDLKHFVLLGDPAVRLNVP